MLRDRLLELASVDKMLLILRHVIHAFHGVRAQELKSHVLVLFEVFYCGIALLLQCFINFYEQLILKLGSFDFGIKVVLILGRGIFFVDFGQATPVVINFNIFVRLR